MSTQQALQHLQGAYLTFPESSFGGTRPFKALDSDSCGSGSGGAFVRRTPEDAGGSAVQQYYIRPDRAALLGMMQKEGQQQDSSPLEPEVSGPATGGGGGPMPDAPSPPPPPRSLPNGVPLRVLDHLREAQQQGTQRVRQSARKVRRRKKCEYT